jgi:hypothetical protein
MMSGVTGVGVSSLPSSAQLDGILLRSRKAVNIGPCRGRNLYRGDLVLLESGSVRTVKSLNVQVTMRSHYWFTPLVVSLPFMLSSLMPMAAESRQNSTYKIQGTVIAVTLTQTPPLIVVKTPLGPKNHMTVGATVTSHTKILRGSKRVALNTIREGEIIWLTYVKAPGGVLAEKILVGA